MGLRERKKLKTRIAIQAHAMRLFRAHGYTETTVEQIAEAAEVSLSTLFRYFPTKEDLVLRDAFDPLFFEAFQKQPAELSTIDALRAAFRKAFKESSTEDMNEREKLILEVPELRAKMLDEFAGSFKFLAALIAERLGKPPDDFSVWALASAIVGIVISAWLSSKYDQPAYLRIIDKGLKALEAGFPM